MIVVSDTSPILNLASINRLGILESLYQKVLIPSAVYDELTRSASEAFPDPPSYPWLVVASARDQARVRQLCGEVDPGEAEAIVLALESRADLLLIDERRGRRIATSLGMRVTGLLGVLAEAKRAGLIQQVKPLLDDLLRVGFWIGADLYTRVLTELGEQ